MFTISPSLYSADLLDLREVIGKLKGFEHLHLDIDDGNFVRGISFGMEVVKGVAECTEIPLDAHLEVLNPMEYVEPLCEAGVEMICAHVESLLKVSTEKAPAAIGPYSQAIVAGGVLYTSGQIPVNPETNAIAGNTIEEQAEQVMKNLGAVLAEAGTTFEKVVKTTCFIADMGDFAKFNEIYAKYFTEKPARSCVAVKTLPKNVLCEVEVIAVV